MPNIVDTYLAYRILRALVTPWTSTEAYEKGFIDAEGNKIKDSDGEISAFDNLMFKLKRLLGSIPFVNQKLASYAAALWLLKEYDDKYDDDTMLEEFYKALQLSFHTNAFVKERNEIREYNNLAPNLLLTKMLAEDGEGGVPANNVGSGNIAGMKGDAGVTVVQPPLYRRGINNKKKKNQKVV